MRWAAKCFCLQSLEPTSALKNDYPLNQSDARNIESGCLNTMQHARSTSSLKAIVRSKISYQRMIPGRGRTLDQDHTLLLCQLVIANPFALPGCLPPVHMNEWGAEEGCVTVLARWLPRSSVTLLRKLPDR